MNELDKVGQEYHFTDSKVLNAHMAGEELLTEKKKTNTNMETRRESSTYGQHYLFPTHNHGSERQPKTQTCDY
jgi:hypothetical protein